ncbi:MAG: phosphoribosyltransferase [Byssovorax cruenta]
MKRFLDRREAGKELAQLLLKFKEQPDGIVLALPRGGVPVGYEVTLALNVPLDVFVVRKLGLPGQEELAIGAIASGGIRILNETIIHALKIDQTVIDRVTQEETQELKRREIQYRGNRPPPELENRTIILIDDGLATGASMLAAVHALRRQRPKKIIIAVPAAAPQAINLLRPEADEIVFVIAPDPFEGVGKWYEDFAQTTDDEVRSLLDDAKRRLVHNR